MTNLPADHSRSHPASTATGLPDADGFGLTWAQSRVRAFHEVFHHPVAKFPASLTPSRVKTRSSWMREELDEFDSAPTLVDQADAMIDLMYFALGTLVEMGVEAEPLFDIVHRANMAKFTDGLESVYRDDGKVAKRVDWKSPEAELERSLVDDYAGYSLVSTSGSSAAACLTMSALALGLHNITVEDIDNSLAGFGGIHEAQGFDMLSGVSFNRFLEPTALRDDYIDFDVLDEATFDSVMDRALGAYRSVVLGVSTDILYRTGMRRRRFVIAARRSGGTLLIVDPSNPDSEHLQTVNIDDLLAAVRNASDGIHRIRRDDRDALGRE